MRDDLIELHLEELPGDCERRAALLRSPRAGLNDLRRLDERIAGRLDVLRMAGRENVVEAALRSLSRPPPSDGHYPAILGADAVPTLLAAIAGDDPERAIAAGATLERMLGVSIASDRIWSPDVADDFDAAFTVATPQPDPALAQAAWDEARPRLGHAARIAGGQDLDGEIDEEELDLLTLRALGRLSFDGFTATSTEPLADGERF